MDPIRLPSGKGRKKLSFHMRPQSIGLRLDIMSLNVELRQNYNVATLKYNVQYSKHKSCIVKSSVKCKKLKLQL